MSNWKSETFGVTQKQTFIFGALSLSLQGYIFSSPQLPPFISTLPLVRYISGLLQI